MNRVFAVLVALVAALLPTAGPASAHAVVLASNPEDGAQIARAPEQVTVTFNEAMQQQFAALTVVGPDGNLWSHGDPVVDGATVGVDVGELGPAGEYTIAFRVTSADGHPVSGTRTFTLTQDGSGTPGAPAAGTKADSPETPAATSADGDDGGAAVWWFVVAAVVVVAGGLWFALRKPKA
ncbi:copper resistance CopC family protein [Rhodococcus phenolicus]|uniref:copper resistance CopC family protein n=1 Tax=Rhodococcus phenolicus TaxID=263849 RepID=UPI0008367F3D|nr:copper resistance CopC family protein [Rhodococcus phenolicus]